MAEVPDSIDGIAYFCYSETSVARQGVPRLTVHPSRMLPVSKAVHVSETGKGL